MFCKNCGNQLNDTATFCGRCGTKIVKNKANTPSTPTHSPYAPTSAPSAPSHSPYYAPTSAPSAPSHSPYAPTSDPSVPTVRGENTMFGKITAAVALLLIVICTIGWYTFNLITRWSGSKSESVSLYKLDDAGMLKAYDCDIYIIIGMLIQAITVILILVAAFMLIKKNDKLCCKFMSFGVITTAINHIFLIFIGYIIIDKTGMDSEAKFLNANIGVSLIVYIMLALCIAAAIAINILISKGFIKNNNR